MEAEEFSARVREGIAKARAEGAQIGRPRQVPERVLARILRERAAGSGLSQIAKGLERDGVLAPAGGRRWYASTVRSIILAAERA